MYLRAHAFTGWSRQLLLLSPVLTPAYLHPHKTSHPPLNITWIVVASKSLQIFFLLQRILILLALLLLLILQDPLTIMISVKFFSHASRQLVPAINGMLVCL